jgi:NAD-dependent deacetylase
VPLYFIDPRPTIRPTDFENLTIIEDTAVNGMRKLARLL